MASKRMFLLESDVQDRHVVLQEYGHFIGEKFVGAVGGLGYEFNDEPAPASDGSAPIPMSSSITKRLGMKLKQPSSVAPSGISPLTPTPTKILRGQILPPVELNT